MTQDLAERVSFPAPPASDDIKGEFIRVDGGMGM